MQFVVEVIIILTIIHARADEDSCQAILLLLILRRYWHNYIADNDIISYSLLYKSHTTYEDDYAVITPLIRKGFSIADTAKTGLESQVIHYIRRWAADNTVSADDMPIEVYFIEGALILSAVTSARYFGCWLDIFDSRLFTASRAASLSARQGHYLLDTALTSISFRFESSSMTYLFLDDIRHYFISRYFHTTMDTSYIISRVTKILVAGV